MKPYITRNHVTPGGLIVLIGGTIICGIAIGALAYFISNLVYFMIIFPLAIDLGSLVVFQGC